MSDNNADLIVANYEVFNNAHNALAFLLSHHAALNPNDEQGPFVFSIQGENIVAGTKEHHVIFPNVKADLIEIARQRGVIMVMEFENQQPTRCTPCYFAEQF